MERNYGMDFTVKHFECDAWLRMSVGAILRRVQTISTLDVDALGLTTQLHKKTNTAFLLSRISVQVTNLPTVYQKVRIVTRAFEAVKAAYSRITTLYNETGEVLCQVDSRWVLIDIGARRILRRPPPQFEGVFMQCPPDVQHDMLLPKASAAFCPPTLCRADYSLCDYNRHINNTSYADLVCNALPLQLFETGHISKMLLFYRAEIGMGQQFEIKSSTVEGGGHYLVFQQGGKKSLEALVNFCQ